MQCAWPAWLSSTRSADIVVECAPKTESKGALLSFWVQTGATVLSAIISLPRGELSVIDGQFLLMVVHSPFAWVFLHQNSFRVLFNHFGQVKSKQVSTWESCRSLTLLSGWICLHLMVWFGGRTFPGGQCEPMTIKHYVDVMALPWASVFTMHWQYIAAWFIPTAIIAVYLVRHLSVSMARHQWPDNIRTVILYLHWSSHFALGTIDNQYDLSYGQIISLLSMLPPLASALKVVWSRQWKEIWTDGVAQVVFLSGDLELYRSLARKLGDSGKMSPSCRLDFLLLVPRHHVFDEATRRWKHIDREGPSFPHCQWQPPDIRLPPTAYLPRPKPSTPPSDTTSASPNTKGAAVDATLATSTPPSHEEAPVSSNSTGLTADATTRQRLATISEEFSTQDPPLEAQSSSRAPVKRDDPRATMTRRNSEIRGDDY
ncbi:hypothetical protein B0H14DRAFT_3148705 [Mycena olivaceomarginata]|nr:hypothetical protein B0H14DRAFT_3148705 [Mycena olivaceomarginata]